ncbi:hypothetical protein UFOVP1596_12 [uncultured Caudovirales phage]|uniref:Holin n=1 Tax=uncultured Caudovirales phage TaxID=2100421 RepID=A0A6J5SV22_9CAUD|nr:hypothetical protein UFOVP1596_12 [uncultured Caudovirales phage]
MTKPKSKKWKLGWRDVVNGLIRSVLASVSATAIQSLTSGAAPDMNALKISALAGGATFVGSLTKSFGTSSDGTFLTKPEPESKYKE